MSGNIFRQQFALPGYGVVAPLLPVEGGLARALARAPVLVVLEPGPDRLALPVRAPDVDQIVMVVERIDALAIESHGDDVAREWLIAAFYRHFPHPFSSYFTTIREELGIYRRIAETCGKIAVCKGTN